MADKTVRRTGLSSEALRWIASNVVLIFLIGAAYSDIGNRLGSLEKSQQYQAELKAAERLAVLERLLVDRDDIPPRVTRVEAILSWVTEQISALAVGGSDHLHELED